METLNIDPNTNILLEIYGDDVCTYDEPLTIPNLSRGQAYEYFMRMTPDTEFQFFRVWPDGSHKEIDFDNTNF